MRQNPALLNTTSQIDKYLTGVNEKAHHHAQSVEKVIPILASALFTLYPYSVVALTRNGELKNAVWVVGQNTNQRYAITYNHKNDCIDLRERSLQGAVLHTYTNSTPVGEITSSIGSL